jgi:SSS family transporter
MALDFDPPAPLPVAGRGQFLGLVKGVLIVAGGARDIPEGGDLTRAAFLDTIHIVKDPGKGKDASWEKSPAKLPVAAAFGAAVVFKDTLYCLGGMTAEGPTARVVRVKYSDGEIVIEEGVRKEEDGYKGIPDLPMPLAFTGAAVMDGKIYVAGGYVGGQTRLNDELLAVEIPRKPEPSGDFPLGPIRDWVKTWRREEDKPPKWEPVETVNPDGTRVDPFGSGLIRPVLDVRTDELAEKNALYIIGGRRYGPETEQLELRREVWKHVPGKKSRDGWKRLADLPKGLAVCSSAPIGPSHLLVLVQKDAGPLRGLADVAPQEGANSYFLYHTYTDTWVDVTREAAVQGGVLLPHDEGFLWVGRPGAGDVEALAGAAPAAVVKPGKIEYTGERFKIVDFAVIGAYIVGLIWIGWYFSKRERDTEDYFLGGRKIPWWAAGLSIYATGVSAISFMAIPAKTYSTDWHYICLGVFPPITTFIAAYAFVPLLRGLKITTMMEYLEMRFGKSVRTISTFLMVVGQVAGRMSVVVLLPSLALSAATGLDKYACVLIMGVLATVYTVMGGISAVIWTDVVQVIVMFGGAILSLILICFQVDGGLLGVIRIGADFGKFRSFDFSLDFTVATFWVFTVWAIQDLFGRIGQESMQRAFSTADVNSAKRSLVTCAVVSVPGTLLFYALGAALFAYYRSYPHGLNPNLDTDATFPLYIVQNLPAGVAGLIIAGLFAAAMSTLDSAMNAIATVITKDWFAAFHTGASERVRLWVARILTMLSGAVGTGLALYMASLNIRSLWDQFSKIMALVGGGFGGVIVLALLTKRTSTAGALIGAVIGSAMTIALETEMFGYKFKFFMYGTMSMTVTFVTGYLISLFMPSRKDLTGLTVWTLKRKAGPYEVPAGPSGK